MQSPLTKYFVTVLRTQGPYREDPPVHMALRAYIPMGARPLSNVPLSKDTNRSLSLNVACAALGKAPPAGGEARILLISLIC